MSALPHPSAHSPGAPGESFRVLIEAHQGPPHTIDDLLTWISAGQGLRQLLTVRGWTVALSDPLFVCHDLDQAAQIATAIGWRESRDPARDPAQGPEWPPFIGGLAGMLADALSPAMLSLPRHDLRPTTAPVPALAFGLYDTAVCRSPQGETWLVAAELPGYSSRPADERMAELRERLDHLPATLVTSQMLQAAPTTAIPSLDKAAHAARVAQILEWIAAGDLYQLNLTLQLSAPWTQGGPALAQRLWAATPGASHAAWLGLPEGPDVVSASPETFLTVDGHQAAIRPIKGTRPRGQSTTQDDAQRHALLNSAKDLAEHVMIVDLERNDLGRVAVAGTVHVAELAAVEAHPTVWHLASTITAQLRADVTLDELIAAAFPCGSVTGAPKRMAVDRIRRVEPTQRGVYCGAIGVISHGLVDLSVAIRTAVVHDGYAHYGSGGGIVADSDPASEWQEVLDKAEAFFVATNSRLA